MAECWVVVVDGTRARFFTLEPIEVTRLEGGPNLKEHKSLVNPQVGMHEADLWSDVKSGRNRTAVGGQAHGYDDHRAGHIDELKRRFARTVAQETVRLLRANRARRVILAAEKRMLGFLRAELEPLAKSGVRIDHVAKDLGKLPAHVLQEYLAAERLLPPRRFPRA